MRRSVAAVFTLLSLAIAACASLPLPEREGVVLYRAKCSGCHRPYAPAERTAEVWRKTLHEMARRAKLSPEEFAAIERYLTVEPIASHAPTQ